MKFAKFKFNKTVQLKLALLLVLAANLSWNSLIDNGSENFASDAIRADSSTTQPAPAPAPAPPSTSTIPTRGTNTRQGVRIPAQPRDGRPVDFRPSEETTSTLNMCGAEFKVRVMQIMEDNRPTIEIRALDTAKNRSTYIKQKDRWASLNEGQKRALLSRIEDQVRTEFCFEEKNRSRRDRAKTDAERKKACEIDSTGRPISRDTRISCLIDRISDIDSADIDAKDADRVAYDEVSRIVGLVRPALKRGLASRCGLSGSDNRKRDCDDNEYDTARDNIKDLISNLRGLRLLGDQGRKVQKMIEEFEGMLAMGRVGHDSYDYLGSAREKSDSLNRAMENYKNSAGTPAATAAWYQFQQARSEYMTFMSKMTFGLQNPVMQLATLSAAGKLNSSDFDLLYPYSQLTSLYKNNSLPTLDMMGIRGGTLAQDPNGVPLYDPFNPMASLPNISSIRSQALNQNSRMGAVGPGYQMPPAPQNTWGNQPVWNSQVPQQNSAWQRPAYMPATQQPMQQPVYQPSTYQQPFQPSYNNTSGLPMKSGW